jgi:DNA-binding PadR family transcriptional regulator
VGSIAFLFPAKGGRAKTLAPKKTDLAVFSDRAARANSAIFEVLAKESPQTIKQLLKKIRQYDGLEETYYASLTKRLHALQETGYIKENKPTRKGAKEQTRYQLRTKALLAMFLKENSMQDILDLATDKQAAIILSALLNVFQDEKIEAFRKK